MLNGSTEIHVDGTASVTVNGTAQYARVTGTVSITVEGDAGMLLGLRGRRYSGQIDGGLTVQIIGTPRFPTYGGSFEAVEYGDEAWGTLDLSQAGEGVGASRFTDFETMITL